MGWGAQLVGDATDPLWQIGGAGEHGQLSMILHGHTHNIGALAFSPAGADRIIRLWTLTEQPWQEPRTPREFRGHADEILALAFAPTGDTLISGRMDGTVRIWDVVSNVTRYISF